MFGFLFDLTVMDVSFISQTLIYPALVSCLAEDADVITLVKPQFEAGRGKVGKNGVVKDKVIYEEVIAELTASAERYGLYKKGVIESPILGGDGNKEFLMYLKVKP